MQSLLSIVIAIGGHHATKKTFGVGASARRPHGEPARRTPNRRLTTPDETPGTPNLRNRTTRHRRIVPQGQDSPVDEARLKSRDMRSQPRDFNAVAHPISDPQDDHQPVWFLLCAAVAGR
jgi:hypothetical protein